MLHFWPGEAADSLLIVVSSTYTRQKELLDMYMRELHKHVWTQNVGHKWFNNGQKYK